MMNMGKNKIIISIGILLISLSSCIDEFMPIKGNGIIITETRRSGLFNKLENSTSIDVVYIKADTTSITIQADENLLEYIVTVTYDNTLEIKIRDGNIQLDFRVRPLITITSPHLEKVVQTGSADFIGDHLSGDAVIIKMSGSGDIAVDQVSCPDLSVLLSGSGNINIKECQSNTSDIFLSGSGNIQFFGQCEDGNLSISGSGAIFAENFILDLASIQISGSGNVFTYVEDNLTALISGSGNIYLRGNPTISQTISGSGKIIKYK